ncbi:hypothetical protein [Streptomyces noursei]|uniref:hypothetical protein n=1 Tax=Streptomyces noursei TaxID=1971 RepID=UPI001675B944|nr:hypothetical protein [Streptomyces noursei]MCZ1019444.1 hypothetical protein [Streptomyces noursei]GGX08450.1 hypothetical protein GCM10010341_32720 [Streptomyces noursei]
MIYREGEVVMDAARMLVGQISTIEGTEITLTRPGGSKWVQEERMCRPASPKEKAGLTPHSAMYLINRSQRP